MRFNLILSLAFSLAFTTLGQAACPEPFFTQPKDIRLTGSAVMIVTHPSTIWDQHYSSKLGMDSAVRKAKSEKIPVIYLEGSRFPETYFFSDCSPDYWVQSAGGEFTFDVPVTQVYSVGGHWEYCQRTTMNDLINSWKSGPLVDRKITQILDGLYTLGTQMSDRDSYLKPFQNFMRLFTQPGIAPRANMYQVEKIINDRNAFVEYLIRNLPPYQKLSPEYRVDLSLNGRTVETLQTGRGLMPVTLTLEFVDTVYDGGIIPVLNTLEKEHQ